MKTVVLILSAIVVASGGTDERLIYLDSEAGRELISESRYKEDFWALSATFATQQTQTFCGIASAVAVLNALPGTKPKDPVFYPWPYYTQQNFFSERVSKHVSMTGVLEMGVVLEMLARTLREHRVQALVTHASAATVAEFRSHVRTTSNDVNDFLLVNFSRAVLGQKGEGHFSPIGAYHEGTDRVLVLDVARYKYTPSWVPVDLLFAAMTGKDSSSGKSRGWIWVAPEELKEDEQR